MTLSKFTFEEVLPPSIETSFKVRQYRLKHEGEVTDFGLVHAYNGVHIYEGHLVKLHPEVEAQCGYVTDLSNVKTQAIVLLAYLKKSEGMVHLPAVYDIKPFNFKKALETAKKYDYS